MKRWTDESAMTFANATRNEMPGDPGVLGDLNDRLIEVKRDAEPIPTPAGEHPAT